MSGRFFAYHNKYSAIIGSEGRIHDCDSLFIFLKFCSITPTPNKSSHMKKNHTVLAKVVVKSVYNCS